MDHPRDHARYVSQLFTAFTELLEKKYPHIQPIEVASAAVLLALYSAEQHSQLPPDEAVKDLLDDLYAIRLANN